MNNESHIFGNREKMYRLRTFNSKQRQTLKTAVKYNRCTNKMAKILAFAANDHEQESLHFGLPHHKADPFESK